MGKDKLAEVDVHDLDAGNKIILCVMTVLPPHFACTSPSEEGGWEVAYRLADEAELSSTTEQKV